MRLLSIVGTCSEQVSQAVGEAGKVGPDRGGHRISLTENMEHPYSSGVSRNLLVIAMKIILPQMT